VSTPTGTATQPQTSTPSNTADVTINVTVANGKVNPSGASINVKAGQTVLITAVSDAADEVHVHGYDKQLPLTPGKPASVRFVANMKGTFEIETHESNKLVAKLVVS
jgi:plastocyanin